MSQTKRIFAVAGEPSGDVHAAHVLAELQVRLPGVEFRGFGGPRMQKAGMHLLEDLASEAIMGLFPVIKSLPKIRKWFRLAEQDLTENRPDALLLIDYPGFNLRLAKIAKSLGIPVIYYISPQVWAWKEKRVEKIRELVDLMIVILPFEKTFFEERGVDVFYCGHPLSDRLADEPADPVATQTLRDDAGGSPIIGLFPGSRPHVVDSLAPEFLAAASSVVQRPGLENAHFLIAAADKNIEEKIKTLPAMAGLHTTVVTGRPFEVMSACDVALTTSGTTTMELAGHIRPMILAYKVSPVLYAVGRMVVKVPFIGLVNLIAEKGIVPEHVGSSSLSGDIADDLADLLLNQERQDVMKSELENVVERLRNPGSYKRCAEHIAQFLGQNDAD